MVTLKETAEAIGDLVEVKNKQYGSAFEKTGQILSVLYPQGILPHQYKDVLAMTRVLDKFFRIANGKQGNENPWQDVAGYGVLMTNADQKELTSSPLTDDEKKILAEIAETENEVANVAPSVKVGDMVLFKINDLRHVGVIKEAEKTRLVVETLNTHFLSTISPEQVVRVYVK